MNIGLIDVDCHASKKKWGATIYPNIAIGKIARFHKQQGDNVEWAMPFSKYDIVYKSKIFNFSPDCDISVHADKIVCGGTGYDVASVLPKEIDCLQPDYSIYPNIPSNTAYGFLTRGCPNKCKWCVVPVKEGKVTPYMDVEDIAIEGRKNLVLMDNNILAAGDYSMIQLDKIISKGYRIDFNQAMDARFVNEDNAKLLAQIKWIDRRIRFGCDTTAQIPVVEKAIDMINGYGYKGEYFLYTMLNDDYQECYKRINYWRGRKNIYPYAQPFRDPFNSKHTMPQWQRDMARWVNKKMIFKTTSFEEFSPRKGFKCKKYNNGR